MSSRLTEQPLDVSAAATDCLLLIRSISGELEQSVLKAKARRPEASHAEPSRDCMQGIATARCAQRGQESLSQVHGYFVAAGNRHERKLVDDDVNFPRGGLKTVVEWDGWEFAELALSASRSRRTAAELTSQADRAAPFWD